MPSAIGPAAIASTAVIAPAATAAGASRLRRRGRTAHRLAPIAAARRSGPRRAARRPRATRRPRSRPRSPRSGGRWPPRALGVVCASQRDGARVQLRQPALAGGSRPVAHASLRATHSCHVRTNASPDARSDNAASPARVSWYTRRRRPSSSRPGALDQPVALETMERRNMVPSPSSNTPSLCVASSRTSAYPCAGPGRSAASTIVSM